MCNSIDMWRNIVSNNCEYCNIINMEDKVKITCAVFFYEADK